MAKRGVVDNWYYFGLVAGLISFALLPIFNRFLSTIEFWTYLGSPVYMMHQFEKHLHDRFRRFENVKLCKGKPGLTDLSPRVDPLLMSDTNFL